MPRDVVLQIGQKTEELDLTSNHISDLRFLIDFPKLTTIILDHNCIHCHVKVPPMLGLHTMWLNHNRVKNLSVFISTISKNCPNLRYLSMMNNPAAPSYFNGGNVHQFKDYRYYVVSNLPKLEVLDDRPVSREERNHAEQMYGRQITVEEKKAIRRKKSKATS
ncbi:hypothetical protein ScPMuIL_002931 [Solemya velum]